MILRCFLGVRQERSALILDPAIPPSLDGLQVEMELLGCRFEVSYRIERTGCGPIAIDLNGADLPFTRLENPYRLGAAETSMETILERLSGGMNRLLIRLA